MLTEAATTRTSLSKGWTTWRIRIVSQAIGISRVFTRLIWQKLKSYSLTIWQLSIKIRYLKNNLTIGFFPFLSSSFKSLIWVLTFPVSSLMSHSCIFSSSSTIFNYVGGPKSPRVFSMIFLWKRENYNDMLQNRWIIIIIFSKLW